ncbi:hypothetical protein N7495_009587 [Penicillium taxi]|uniref:uncharacterized protein n=1 Tax=Penicillium taxi TaxID=168475 RepID=UPI0025458B38|nr:uncharacterized protein N7495_009587 [Penicillium taxi]KAJ5885077.1 hypothetical protein N7495_009587 [Penicillium taxi]
MGSCSFLLIFIPIVLALLIQTVACLHQKVTGSAHLYETRYTTLIPAEIAPTTSLIIDTFQNPTHNDLGFWHGAGEGLTTEYTPGFIRLYPTDPDQNFHTQFETNGCFSLLPWQNQFLHVVFDGSEDFSISMNEHNSDCYTYRSPFPGTPDSVEAARYVMRTRGDSRTDGPDNEDGQKVPANPTNTGPPWSKNGQSRKPKCDEEDRGPTSPEKTEIFVPLSHFRINHSRVVSISFSGFYSNVSMALHRIEIVPKVPPPSPENQHFIIPENLPTGTLVLRCSRPNSFAFGIDDGSPQFAQEVMRILDAENVKVTFFAVGAGLSDKSTNFTEFYKEMLQKGHQVALHSNTHPKMEALPTAAKIDEEIVDTLRVFKDQLNIESRYFRPPFGTIGARMRQELAKYIHNPYIVNWTVDIEDWKWANTSVPERQLQAFYRGVAMGGNLAVMHFLNPTTVDYLPEFIRHVKESGLKIMRIDQCLEDPDSPPL